MSKKVTNLKLPVPEDTDAPDGPTQLTVLAEKVAELLEDKVLVPACSVYSNANQSIPNKTFTPVNLQVEEFDTSAMHSTSENKSRITVPEAGLYAIIGSMVWAPNITGLRSISIWKNGSPMVDASDRGEEAPEAGMGGNAQVISDLLPLTAGQYVELVAWQASGGALNVMAGDAAGHKAMLKVWKVRKAISFAP